MLRGWAAVWGGIGHVYGRMFAYVGVNLLWLVCSLPIVTAPAAWAGLCRFSYHALRQPTVDMDEYWAGFRAYVWRGMPIGIVGLVLVVTSLFNLIAYPAGDDTFVNLMRVVWIMLPLAWFAVQLYAFPLLNAQVKPSLIGAYRNAGTMVILNPFYTLALWIGALLLVVVSFVFPVMLALLTGSLLAAMGNYAVQDRLRAAGIERTPERDERGSVADYEGYT